MNKVTKVLGSLAIASAMTLTACAPGTSTDTAPEQETQSKELTYLYFTDGPDQKATENLIKKFEESSGATVKLEIVPFDNLEQTLQARLSGDNAPDVARLSSLSAFREDLLDLNKFKSEELDGKFLPGAESYTHNEAGELLAVPSDLTMNGPIINEDQFKKAGVPVPTTENPWKSWQEMSDAAKKVKEANGTEYGMAMDVSGHRFSTMLSQYGTTLYSPDGKSVALDTTKAAKAIKDFNDLNQAGVMPKDLFIQSGSKYKAASDIFLAQQTPVYLSGNWQVAAFDQKANFGWKAVPNPCEERCGGFPGGKFMAGFKQSKNQQLAAEFIAFMNSAESQKQMSNEANFLPTRTDLIESGVSYDKREEDMKVFLADVKKTPEDTYGTTYSDGFTPAGKVLVNEVSGVLTGTGTPEGAAAAIKAGAEKALE